MAEGAGMKPRGRTRLKDIAEKTGFSINTVSVALRGGEKVPRSTRKIILDAARQLNYLPNALARSLASNNSRMVGVVLSHLLSPILAQCAQLIERRLEGRGYRMMLMAANGDHEREKIVVDALRAHQVEGILIYPSDLGRVEHLVSLRQAGFPVVLLSGTPGQAVDLVSVDDRTGMAKLTSHMIELGHRRIALVDVCQRNGDFRKLAGYQDALRAHGIPFDDALVVCPRGHNTAASGYEAAGALAGLNPKPTAVLGSSDPIAIGVMGWCRDHGIGVPVDLSVGGFDDIESAAYLSVPLTTVGYSASGVSEQAVARLMSLIEAGTDLPEPMTVLIDPGLVVRRSAQPPATARSPSWTTSALP